MNRVFRVLIAKLHEGEEDPLPLGNLIDYVTARDEKDALDVCRRARPELAQLSMYVEREIVPVTTLWRVFVGMRDVRLIVLVDAPSKDQVHDRLLGDQLGHPWIGPQVEARHYEIGGAIDQEVRAAWA